MNEPLEDLLLDGIKGSPHPWRKAAIAVRGSVRGRYKPPMSAFLVSYLNQSKPDQENPDEQQRETLET